MASGGAFHVAYYHATQQAFLEAHELAFGYFGGVFKLLRYDNPRNGNRGREGIVIEYRSLGAPHERLFLIGELLGKKTRSTIVGERSV
jgi:hypothetical protein